MTEAPTADVAPGFLAFVAFFLLALALWFLMRNMNARMRRMSYRQQQAHRGRDEPQAGPGEWADDEGSVDAPSDDAPSQDPGSDGAGSDKP
jgi:hypothetical protein